MSEIINELAQNRAVRQALERAAVKIEEQAGNLTYQAAYKIAARIIRGLKPD